MLTTLEVAAFLRLGRTIDARWVDWAVSMLETGRDSKALRILAGEEAPFNPFEMEGLVRGVLSELGIAEFESRTVAARALARAKVTAALASRLPLEDALSSLCELCSELGDPPFLFDFYLLHYQYQDAKNGEMGRYWPGATPENIDRVVEDRFRSWLTENPGQANLAEKRGVSRG